MFDIATLAEEAEASIRELGLDPKNRIHQAAARAFYIQRSIYEPAKKVSVKRIEDEFDRIAKESVQLYKRVSSLPIHYKDILRNYLFYRFKIDCNFASQSNVNGMELIFFLHSLANSALLAKEHNDFDIPSGFYNSFLYFFVDNVLSSNQSNSLILIKYLIKTRIKKLTQDTIEQFLYDRWKRLHKREATKTAIHIISTKLCTSQNEESAKKTVRRNLDEIVKTRVQIIANHLIEEEIFANWPAFYKKLI